MQRRRLSALQQLQPSHLFSCSSSCKRYLQLKWCRIRQLNLMIMLITCLPAQRPVPRSSRSKVCPRLWRSMYFSCTEAANLVRAATLCATFCFPIYLWQPLKQRHILLGSERSCRASKTLTWFSFPGDSSSTPGFLQPERISTYLSLQGHQWYFAAGMAWTIQPAAAAACQAAHGQAMMQKMVEIQILDIVLLCNGSRSQQHIETNPIWPIFRSWLAQTGVMSLHRAKRVRLIAQLRCSWSCRKRNQSR